MTWRGRCTQAPAVGNGRGTRSLRHRLFERHVGGKPAGADDVADMHDLTVGLVAIHLGYATAASSRAQAFNGVRPNQGAILIDIQREMFGSAHAAPPFA